MLENKRINIVIVCKGQFELLIHCAILLFVSRQENLKMSSCVSAVLICIACDEHLSPRQLTHKHRLHYKTFNPCRPQEAYISMMQNKHNS